MEGSGKILSAIPVHPVTRAVPNRRLRSCFGTGLSSERCSVDVNSLKRRGMPGDEFGSQRALLASDS